jgi:acetylornithine aminotransferase
MTSPVANTYKRLPVSFTHGEGVWLHDESGKRYLDALSGIAVCGLGHAHP